MRVRSVTVELEGVVQRVVSTYVGYFNRGRRRDGPLVRGHYESRPMVSVHCHGILVSYSDRGAPPARIGTVRQRPRSTVCVVHWPPCTWMSFASLRSSGLAAWALHVSS